MPGSVLKIVDPPESLPWQAEDSRGPKSRTVGISKRLRKYEQAKKSTTVIMDYIVQNLNNYCFDAQDVLSRAIKRMDGCGNYLQFYHYFLLDKYKLKKAQFCEQHLLCPVCAIRRAVVNHRAFLNKFEYMKLVYPELRYSLLTLTVRHCFKNTLSETEHKLRRSFKLAVKKMANTRYGRTSSVFGKFLGWVAVLEVTNSGVNGFHPHLHVLVLHDEDIKESEIQVAWLMITGDSTQVDFTAGENPDNPGKDFAEIFKYTCKFNFMSNEHIVETYLTLRGRRLIFSGGIFRGVKVPDDMLDEDFFNSPYVDMFYQYSKGAGYSLKQCSVVHPTEQVYEWFTYSHDPKPVSEWKYQFDTDSPADAFVLEVHGISVKRSISQYTLSLVDLNAPVSVWKPTDHQLSMTPKFSFEESEPEVKKTVVDYVNEAFYS